MYGAEYDVRTVWRRVVVVWKQVITAAAIYLAARTLGIALPDSPPWCVFRYLCMRVSVTISVCVRVWACVCVCVCVCACVRSRINGTYRIYLIGRLCETVIAGASDSGSGVCNCDGER